MEDDYIVMVNSIQYEQLKKQSTQLIQSKSICQKKDSQLQKLRSQYVIQINQKQFQLKKTKHLNDTIFDLMSYLLKIDQQIQFKTQQLQCKAQECMKLNKQKANLQQITKIQQLQLTSLKQQLVFSENEIKQCKKLLFDLKSQVNQTHNTFQQQPKQDPILFSQADYSKISIQRQKLLLLTISRIIDERSLKAKQAQQSKRVIKQLQKYAQDIEIQLKKQKNIIKNYETLEKQMQIYQTQIKSLQQQKDCLRDQLEGKYKEADSMTQLIKQYEKADQQNKNVDGITKLVQEAIIFFKGIQKELSNFAINDEQERYNILEAQKVHLINEIHRKITFANGGKKQKKQKKQKIKQ